MQTAVDKAQSFVASQFASRRAFPPHPTGTEGPAVTISHQSGSGAQEVADLLAELLKQADPGALPWTVLDRQLIERALAEHQWPPHLLKKIPEDKRSYLDDVLDDLFGLRPPSWVLVPQIVETMRRLAEAGHVVLIGHGATIITRRLANVFHARLVAPLATRISRVQASHNLTAEAANDFVETEDRGRRRYVRANFHARLEDELLYDVVVNTEHLACADAAAIIAAAARRYFQSRLGRPPLGEPPPIQH
ncbi:putative cytidylate kinase [Verrucomicrobia bacterium]|nr:putative cytidylate kinase [Verrucomicrobiota bacterium]